MGAVVQDLVGWGHRNGPAWGDLFVEILWFGDSDSMYLNGFLSLSLSKFPPISSV